MGNTQALHFSSVLRDLQCERRPFVLADASPFVKEWVESLFVVGDEASSTSWVPQEAEMIVEALMGCKAVAGLPVGVYGAEVRLGLSLVQLFRNVRATEDIATTNEAQSRGVSEGGGCASLHCCLYLDDHISICTTREYRGRVHDAALSLRVGDHVYFCDSVGTDHVLEHHMVIVALPTDGFPVACGLMHRTPWYASVVTLLSLGTVNKDAPLFVVRYLEQAPGQQRFGLVDCNVSDRVQRAMACVGLQKCWSAGGFNCEDFMHWVCCGLSFSFQRMRGVFNRRVQEMSLVEPCNLDLAFQRPDPPTQGVRPTLSDIVATCPSAKVVSLMAARAREERYAKIRGLADFDGVR